MSEPSISGHHITVTIDSLLCDGVTRLSLIVNIIFPVFCTLLSCYALESWFAVNLRLLLWRAACICLAHYPCKGQHMQRKSWWQETRTALMVFLTMAELLTVHAKLGDWLGSLGPHASISILGSHPWRGLHLQLQERQY